MLVDEVDEEEDFQALLLGDLKEGRFMGGSEGLAGEVVNVLQALRHASDVI